MSHLISAFLTAKMFITADIKQDFVNPPVTAIKSTLKQVSFRCNTVILVYTLTRYYRTQLCVLLSSIARLNFSTTSTYGPGSSVGIATDYGLDGPGSNSGGEEIFLTCPDRPWGPLSLLYNGYQVFPGGKVGRSVMLTTNLLLAPWSWKSRAIPLPTLWATPGL
jgi:hypothetical protein